MPAPTTLTIKPDPEHWVEAILKAHPNAHVRNIEANARSIALRQWRPSAQRPTVSEVARCCHEAVRALAACYGDFSIPSWDAAPAWQVESACHGVAQLIHNPSLTPKELHELWMQHKLDEGWRYGSTKDPTQKTHPCLVPYDQLPAVQRAKDHVFRAVALSVLALREGA